MRRTGSGGDSLPLPFGHNSGMRVYVHRLVMELVDTEAFLAALSAPGSIRAQAQLKRCRNKLPCPRIASFGFLCLHRDTC